MNRRRKKGFTLIELMVTVAIVSILASIAYPSYTSSVLKGKRAQAKVALAELLQQQERFMTQRNCYMAFTTDTTGTAVTTAAPACGFTAGAAVPFKTFSGDSLAKSAYLLMADACPANSTSTSPTMSTQECIRVIAKPIGNDPAVGSLRMTSSGAKDCTAPASNPDALAMPPSTLCWP
jgi:type IV pilus assembly protein PilE